MKISIVKFVLIPMAMPFMILVAILALVAKLFNPNRKLIQCVECVVDLFPDGWMFPVTSGFVLWMIIFYLI